MPRAILRAAEAKLFIPTPPVGDLHNYLLDFLVAMWPPSLE